MGTQESRLDSRLNSRVNSLWRSLHTGAAPGWGKHVRWPYAVPLLVLLLLGSQLLVAALPSVQVTQAHANKARLDQELARARTQLAIPESLLGPMEAREQAIGAGQTGASYDYDVAAQQYDALYSQLLGVEKTALPQMQAQAQQAMQEFSTLLNARRSQGFTEADAYQQRFAAAQQAFDNAKTPDDFASVSTLATAQTQALQALWPAYQKLQTLQGLIKTLQGAGINTRLAEQFYTQDQQVIRDGASTQRYVTLTGVVDAQMVQLQADQAGAQPFIASALLDRFQARIKLLQQYLAGFQSVGDLVGQYGNTPTAATFQSQHDADVKQLHAAKRFADYASLASAITSQDNALDSPLLRAKTLYDYQQFTLLVQSVAGRTIINEQPNQRFHSGRAYPLAYEYIGEDGLYDNDIGIGPASKPSSYARTDAQFQAADFRIDSLMVNLRALLDDYDPAVDQVNALDDAARINAVHQQPHATDLQLLQYYNVMSGKVIVVSLREQVARYYDNGQLVGFSYVTTGDPDVPSVPGFWTAINEHSPSNPNSCNTHPGSCPRDSNHNPIPIPAGFGDVFTPPTPGEYAPTPIKWDIAYHEGGFWLHDAYWRHQFGPETDLPHYDPNAFSSGSHGCVNIPEATSIGWDMQQVYNWTPLGTPIIIY